MDSNFIIPNASYLHSLTKWIMAQPRKCLIDNYDNTFRYVAFAQITRKMSVLIEPESNAFEAVIFHWRDFQENIEAKEHYKAQQFEYKNPTGGDALFVGEAIGTRKGVATLYNYFFRKYPSLVTHPIYTYRHGKIRKLNPKLLEKFMDEGRVA